MCGKPGLLIADMLICIDLHVVSTLINMVVFYFSVNPFTTTDCILTDEAVSHITDRHLIQEKGVKKSLFCTTFPLEDALKNVAWYTWEKDSKYATLLETGFRQGHGIYRIYVFDMGRHLGWDPQGFPTQKMAVYYAEPVAGEKWSIISAYPWTFTYDCIHRSRHR